MHIDVSLRTLLSLSMSLQDSVNKQNDNVDSAAESSISEATGQVYNIVAFGETGVGKSSLVKMLCPSTENQPTISRDTACCTTESAGYWMTLENATCRYRIWDTPGLNETEYGTVELRKALDVIHHLVEELTKENQCVNLLMYCIRASEYRPFLRVDYDLVAKLICDDNVPVVAVINGLENEDNMEDWWKRNHKQLEKDMKFQDHVCMTTTKGKWNGSRFVFQNEYDESREKMKEVIRKNCSTKPWKIIDFATFDEKRTEYMVNYKSRTEPERKLVGQFIKLVKRH